MNKLPPTAEARTAALRAAMEKDETVEPISSRRLIVEQRQIIRVMRDSGRKWIKIKKYLEMIGIHITEGTLRNYIAEIDAAERQLGSLGNASPSDKDILVALSHKKIPRKEVKEESQNDLGRMREKPLRPIIETAPGGMVKPSPGITRNPKRKL
jgi:hypothetical protein